MIKLKYKEKEIKDLKELEELYELQEASLIQITGIQLRDTRPNQDEEWLNYAHISNNFTLSKIDNNYIVEGDYCCILYNGKYYYNIWMKNFKLAFSNFKEYDPDYLNGLFSFYIGIGDIISYITTNEE